MKKTEIFCDICKQSEVKGFHLSFPLQVIYSIEQEEGHTVKPYLDTDTLDICLSCMDKITAGNHVFCDSLQLYHFKTL